MSGPVAGPEVLSCALPEPLVALSAADRERRVRTVADGFLLLDGARGFVRCRLPLVAQDPAHAFAYICWVEVPPEELEGNRLLWSNPTTRGLVKFKGHLANALPPFEEEVGAGVSVAVPDWKSSEPTITAVEGNGWLAKLSKPPGADAATHQAFLGEVQREHFVLESREKFRSLWGDPSTYEELEGKEWLHAPRKLVIAEFQPKTGDPWRYATLGLSSRPMPEGDRVEFLWEVPRRVTGGETFRAMARLAAQPWQLRVAFFDGYVLPVPGGFPPGSDFKYALCYDATRAYPALADLKAFGQRVRVLIPLPILEREKRTMRKDETGYLNLKDFIR